MVPHIQDFYSGKKVKVKGSTEQELLQDAKRIVRILVKKFHQGRSCHDIVNCIYFNNVDWSLNKELRQYAGTLSKLQISEVF